MAQFLSEDILVKSDGIELDGIQSMSLELNIDAVASRFSLGFSDRSPLGDYVPLEIYLHDQLRLTGYGEADVGSEDKDKAGYSVSGRSKTNDLINGCVLHPTGEWINQDLRFIAGEIVSPFESKLSVRGDVGLSFSSFKVSTSEKASAALRRLLSSRGLVMRDTPRGDLLISSPVWRKSKTRLIRRVDPTAQDNNVLRSSVKRDNSKRHDVVIVRGQAEGWNVKDVQIEGRAVDQNVRRYRPLILSAPKGVTAEDAQTLAEYEVSRRLGEALTWRGKVRGWMDWDGRELWDVGTLIPVLDDKFLVDAELLITGVTFSLSPTDGPTTELTLQPPSAYLPKPVIVPTGTSVEPWSRLSAEVNKKNG